MRLVWLAGFALAACGQPRPTSEPVVVPAITPRLQPPPPLVDLDAPDAPYRVAIALQLQPGWAQFLDDCRLRLPGTHPLNAMALAATAEIGIDAGGRVVDVHVESSGNLDYDRAVRQVIEDAAPLPRPPRTLWADDDLVHVRWLFARDRRQAGPATARVVPRDLPVREVVGRLTAAGDLTRAAQRIRRAPPASDRDAATHTLMTHVLREALASTDGTVRRAAVSAAARAGVRELAPAIRDLLTTTSDVELRIAAFAASADLADRATIPIALDQLRTDLIGDRRLALAEVHALVALGGRADAATVLLDHVDHAATPNPTALLALADVPVPELGKRLVSWQAAGDARVRAAACSALSAAPGNDAPAAVIRGLRDRDATVRASCVDAIARRALDARAAVARIRELTRDRDALVRARAILALGAVDPDRLIGVSRGRRADPSSASSAERTGGRAAGAAGELETDGSVRAADRAGELETDRAAEVRAADRAGELEIDRSADVRSAYAQALARAAAVTGGESALDAETRIRVLLDDRDADVRAAAWRAWLTVPPGPSTHGDRARLALRASTDPAPQVRTASLVALDDDAALTRLATTDDDPETRTAALVALAGRSGRAATADLLLQRLADATPGSAERVRTALAWLLAR